MLWLVVIFHLFLVGLCVGSFINVVIYRSLHGDSPTRGRSYCDHCKRQLNWFENIPLLSYVVLGGKCRTCKTGIDISYPIVELVTGLLFTWWASLGYVFFQLTQSPLNVIQPLFWLSVGLILLFIFFIDLRYYVIPDLAVVMLTVLTLLYRLVLVSAGEMRMIDFGYSIMAGVGASVFFLMLYFVTKRKGIGEGDITFAFPMGLLLGYPRIVVGLFLSFLIGGIFGAVLLLVGKRRFGQAVPFGPFLILGLVISLMFGTQIWDWYMQLLRY